MRLGLEFLNLFFAGLLAGQEFIVRYGIRDALSVLDSSPQIQLRKALILRMRILGPIVFALSFFSGVAVAIVDGLTGSPLSFQCLGVFTLIIFISVTLAGTVPINKSILAWQIDAPPADWRESLARWEKLDTIRCWTAVAAFLIFSVATALRISVA